MIAPIGISFKGAADGKRIADFWEKEYPRATRQIREQIKRALAIHELPTSCRRRVYTTNMVERVMAETRQRTGVVGFLPNEAAADRQVGTHPLERHETWACDRGRYLTMDWNEERQCDEKKRRVEQSILVQGQLPQGRGQLKTSTADKPKPKLQPKQQDKMQMFLDTSPKNCVHQATSGLIPNLSILCV